MSWQRLADLTTTTSEARFGGGIGHSVNTAFPWGYGDTLSAKGYDVKVAANEIQLENSLPPSVKGNEEASAT